MSAKPEKMPPKRRVKLSEVQRRELEQARDRHGKAYVREAAAAILKVADGHSAGAVALKGLLKVRDSESVSQWINRYQQRGIEGLLVSAGRGRKAPFSPSTQPGRARGGSSRDRG